MTLSAFDRWLTEDPRDRETGNRCERCEEWFGPEDEGNVAEVSTSDGMVITIHQSCMESGDEVA